MPVDAIKIPQNVYIEDRIVGPLTLKQVITVAIGCGFSYAIYAMIAKQYGAVSIPLTVMVWLPGLLSFAFAFLKINDLSLLKICFLMMEHINKPATRTWAPRRGIAINIRTFSAPEQTQSAQTHRTALAAKKPQHIEELSGTLDLLHTEKEPEQPAEVTAEEPVQSAPRPVNPSRVTASPLESDMATTGGSVSVFRDISPRQA